MSDDLGERMHDFKPYVVRKADGTKPEAKPDQPKKENGNA